MKVFECCFSVRSGCGECRTPPRTRRHATIQFEYFYWISGTPACLYSCVLNAFAISHRAFRPESRRGEITCDAERHSAVSLHHSPRKSERHVCQRLSGARCIACIACAIATVILVKQNAKSLFARVLPRRPFRVPRIGRTVTCA